jgi:hypothetical protein
MTTYHIRLAFDLLDDLFPDRTCKQVASYLNRKGPLGLNLLVRDMNLPAKDIARALATLAMHDIIDCQTDGRADSKNILYAFNLKRTLYLLHYSKCIHCARQLYGFDGELIIEELLLNGKQRMSTLLVQVYERLIKAGKDPHVHSLQSIKETFQMLVTAQYLQRVTIHESTMTLPTIIDDILSSTDRAPELSEDGWRYLLTNQQTTDEPMAKKLKTMPTQFGDEKVFWKVHFQRFFAHLRDQELIQAFTNRIDQVSTHAMNDPFLVHEFKSMTVMLIESCYSLSIENAGDIVRTMLRLAEVKPNPERTISISFIDV